MKHTQKRQRKQPSVTVIGFDSETLQGPPITLQFFSPDVKRITDCIFIGKRRAVDCFLAQIEKLPAGRYRMYGHNLEFDMLSVLWECRESIRDGNIDLRIGNWIITGRYSKPIFAVFDDGKRYIELVDSFSWFMSSLDAAGKIVCPHLPKLMRPAGLGTTMYKRNDKGFVEYAMRDAEVAYHLGLAIERFHDELEVPSQISLASMAAAVFRLRYMQDNIYQPPIYEWMVGAAAAYHGGVNRVRSDAAPAWHKPVTALDLSSAYPDAAQGLPSFEDPNGYKTFKPRTISKVTRSGSIPDLGIYRISGSAANCEWPALFDHDFKPLNGRFENVWVTGVELNAAIKHGEVKLAKLSGYHYDGKSSNGYSPFNAYMREFYRLKSEAADPVMRYMYKIILNALTGKFIQTSPDYTLVDGKLVKINRAGGLYHPFIAGSITGHCRAHIHDVEHEYEAIHTATDGVFVPGEHSGAAKKQLGAVVSEGVGSLALFRNKTYIFYSNTATESSYPSQIFENQHILKCARHGFQGTVLDLERMLVTNDRTYRTNKPIKLKTAIKTNDVPNKFVINRRQMHVNEPLRVFNYES